MMRFTFYALPSLLSAAILLFLSAYTLLRRRDTTGAWPFIFLTMTGWQWASCYALTLMSVDLPAKVFWFNVSQLGPGLAPVLWLLLAIDYTNRLEWLSPRRVAGLFALPLLTFVLMWTNDWHHLVRQSVSLAPIAHQVTYLWIERGPWFWVEVIYAYGVMSIAFLMFLRASIKTPFKGQAIALLVGMTIPFLSNLLDVLQMNPLKPYGPTSIVFSLTGLVLAWGLFQKRLFDITPIAHDKVFETIADAVLVVDSREHIVDLNPAARRLLGAMLIGESVQTLIKTIPEWEKLFTRTGDSKMQVMIGPEGESRAFDVIVSPLSNERRLFGGWVAILHDISEEKKANEILQAQLQEIQRLQLRLHEQAVRDPLTGCFNRRYLEETLTREILHAERNQHSVGLMMLDLDHFKQVNDVYGHGVGDTVLQEVSRVLQDHVRLGDLVCRFGGEEFLIVFPGISQKALFERGQDFRARVDALTLPTPGGAAARVTASVGVALYPQHGGSMEELIERVDQALYAAKRAGRNCVRVWDENVLRG